MVTATLGKETVSKSGGVIKQMGANALIYAEVTNNYSYLKIAPNSSFYDDYTPASVGLRDYVKGLSDGYYKLAFGGYVAKENVKLVEGVELNRGKVLSVHAKVNGTDTINNKNNFTDVTFACLENVPVNAVASAGKITVTFYNSDPAILPAPVIEANPLISMITAAAVDDTTLVYTIYLKDELNAYGYNVIYENGNIIVRMNNPQKLSGDPSRSAGRQDHRHRSRPRRKRFRRTRLRKDQRSHVKLGYIASPARQVDRFGRNRPHDALGQHDRFSRRTHGVFE